MTVAATPITDPLHPAYREGWWANATGWGLGPGHTFQYRQGWLARERFKDADVTSVTPQHVNTQPEQR